MRSNGFTKKSVYIQLLKIRWILLFGCLSACSSNLVVTGDFPSPLVKADPHRIGVYFDEDFRNYTYQEKDKDRGQWKIEKGQAQQKLFNTVLNSIFEEATTINQLPSVERTLNDSLDFALHPKVAEFQYSIPRETKFKIYEVWIKYNLSAYDRDGQLIADWLVTAYGKTPTAFMQSGEDAMNAAVVVALRDLGANLSLTMLKVPELKAWLDSHPARALTASQTYNVSHINVAHGETDNG